jgi:hypothetical protein
VVAMLFSPDPPAPTPAPAHVQPAPAPTPSLTKPQLVDRIIALNSTASPDFLGVFSETALTRYLEHLQAAQEPRGSRARWIRPGDSPAIQSRESRD